ncbi:MAG: DNA-processing protein DprA [Patescibacteria group bacterium]|nr:DNA-processing protein DprA [Patescibacteria group bacterium]MDD4304786.1 DNA-processing protein DprA [Patescibacteria group bacterium]MDD4695271.1 DNA-processing protein DprA [Patescibacteria group bacterium]
MKSNFEEAHRKIILGLFLIPNLGFCRITKLYEEFGDWEKIWNLNYSDFKKINFPENLTNCFIQERDKINVEKTWNLYKNQNIKIITFFDNEYPYLLKQTYSPPLVIFARGNINLLQHKNFLSVVGTRRNTQYGKSVVQNFVRPVAEQNITIVSGLAIGIDSLAHIESLDTSGSTIAVLGTPIDKIYPNCNYNLAQKILKNGLIISEMPINTPFVKENFARRNRIIAGLSQATFVVEAGEKSGALITSEFAINENREILTVTGSIFDNYVKGNIRLIKQGAKIIEKVEDILEIYGKKTIMIKENIDFINFENEQQKIIYKILLNGPCHIDKIIEYSTLKANVVISNLTQMEISKLINNTGGQIYQIKK